MARDLDHESSPRPWRHHGLSDRDVTTRWRRYGPTFLTGLIIGGAAAVGLFALNRVAELSGTSRAVVDTFFSIAIILAAMFGFFTLTAFVMTSRFITRHDKERP